MFVVRSVQFVLKYLLVPLILATLFTLAEMHLKLVTPVTTGLTAALKGAIWLVADLRNREPDYASLSFITNQFSTVAVGSLLGLAAGRLLSLRRRKAANSRVWRG